MTSGGPTRGTTKAAARRARAAQLASEQSAQARRQARIRATGGVLVVVIVIAALVISSIILGHGKPKSGAQRSVASAPVVAAATGVPASVLNAIGAGSAQNDPADLTGQDLPTTGKPQVLYIGAEWCPYCAAERWPMVVALSRFGTFTGLGAAESSPTDTYPHTQTFSFHDATYTSSYLEFVSRESQSNQVEHGRYTVLDPLTAEQKSLFGKGGGGFPYLNVGGKYRVGVQYDPAVLKGLSMTQIADALADRNSPVAKAVDGSANILTAAICAITGGQPAAVCTSPGVSGVKNRVGGSR